MRAGDSASESADFERRFFFNFARFGDGLFVIFLRALDFSRGERDAFRFAGDFRSRDRRERERDLLLSGRDCFDRERFDRDRERFEAPRRDCERERFRLRDRRVRDGRSCDFRRVSRRVGSRDFDRFLDRDFDRRLEREFERFRRGGGVRFRERERVRRRLERFRDRERFLEVERRLDAERLRDLLSDFDFERLLLRVGDLLLFSLAGGAVEEGFGAFCASGTPF
mgnify:CR=1 FL=1